MTNPMAVITRTRIWGSLLQRREGGEMSAARGSRKARRLPRDGMRSEAGPGSGARRSTRALGTTCSAPKKPSPGTWILSRRFPTRNWLYG